MALGEIHQEIGGFAFSGKFGLEQFGPHLREKPLGLWEVKLYV